MSDLTSPVPSTESRWPAALATVLIMAFQIVLPTALLPTPRLLLPGLELLLLVALLITNPYKLDEMSKDMRWLGLTLLAVLTLADIVTLTLLLHRLVYAHVTEGRPLLYSAVGVWLTTTLTYTLIYWELDRGGPCARATAPSRGPDFLFTEMQNPTLVSSPWAPHFVDYLYLALTNSLAFSPTDTMPLSRAAKILMGSQSLLSVAAIILVGARAVNILT